MVESAGINPDRILHYYSRSAKLNSSGSGFVTFIGTVGGPLMRIFGEQKVSFQLKYQCCGSVMFIPDPDFYPYRIQQQHQKRRGKKIFLPFFGATNIIKL
jgi:hypothetical protein